MRLVDRVVNASATVELESPGGRRHLLPGVGAKSADIRRCQLRYILDRTASEECLNLISSPSNGLFERESPLFRMPAENFWVELFEAGTGQAKIGLLVETEPGGRRGILTGYFLDESGRPDKIGAWVEFDLDSPPRLRSRAGVGMTHDVYCHLNELLQCAVMRVEPEWEQFFRSRDGLRYMHTINGIGANAWYFLPIACAFAAMLNSPELLIETPSNLGKLNSARLRRGRTPLLDHLEVSIRLGENRSVSRGARPIHTKASPRLHHVRGHYVHRAGKTFWRSPHLRGDADRAIVRKTVRVLGALSRPTFRAGRVSA